MTRVTFGMYRKGAREPTTTLRSVAAGADFTPPTPMPTATAAIVRHHREGPVGAAAAMDRSYRNSSYWGKRGTPQAGWADAMRRCYATYADLTRNDSRPHFALGLNRDLALPPNELGVYIDVVLIDPGGYVPRIVLWDTNALTPALAAQYGAPVWRVAEDELGDDRVPRVEIWSLRAPTLMTLSADDARTALPTVDQIVARLVS